MFRTSFKLSLLIVLLAAAKLPAAILRLNNAAHAAFNAAAGDAAHHRHYTRPPPNKSSCVCATRLHGTEDRPTPQLSKRNPVRFQGRFASIPNSWLKEPASPRRLTPCPTLRAAGSSHALETLTKPRSAPPPGPLPGRALVSTHLKRNHEKHERHESLGGLANLRRPFNGRSPGRRPFDTSGVNQYSTSLSCLSCCSWLLPDARKKLCRDQCPGRERKFC